MMMINREQVESKLKKFGIMFPEKNRWLAIDGIFKQFQKKILLDQKRKLEQEMEKRRDIIFRQRLLSRVSGSVLYDIYGRF